jgi:general secretion pathway protein D
MKRPLIYLAPALVASLLAIAADAPSSPAAAAPSSPAALPLSLNERPMGTAKFTIDTDAKTLMVVADEETNAAITKLLEQLDRPVPQALIKVLFLEVTLTDDLDLGTEFSYSTFNDNGAKKSTYSSNFGLPSSPDQYGQLKLINTMNSNLSVTLKALATASKVEVLSRPSIMTRSNEEATITIGDSVPFISNSQTTSTGLIVNSVQYQDIGIILKVTPRIDPNGMVEMTVDPEISKLVDTTVKIAEGVNAFQFTKRSASTKVIIPSGKTVVIGGLISNDDTKTENRIPILGSIPVIGYLFRHTVTKKVKKELLIFLTPTIVDTNESMTAMSQEATSTPLAKKRIAEKDMKEYLPENADTEPKGKPTP